MANEVCPCHSGLTHAQCCQPFLAGVTQAEYAEQLMRSRYTAFALQNANYLLSTWHHSTRPLNIRFDPQQHWHKLTIHNVIEGNPSNDEGWVEFVAVYKINGRAHRLHENSHFIKENNIWYYLAGDIC